MILNQGKSLPIFTWTSCAAEVDNSKLNLSPDRRTLLKSDGEKKLIFSIRTSKILMAYDMKAAPDNCYTRSQEGTSDLDLNAKNRYRS